MKPAIADARETLAARPFWPERRHPLRKRLRGRLRAPPAPVAAKIAHSLCARHSFSRSDSIGENIAGLQTPPSDDFSKVDVDDDDDGDCDTRVSASRSGCELARAS